MKLRDVTYIMEYPSGVFKYYSDLYRPDKVEKVLLRDWIRIRFPQGGPQMTAEGRASSMGLTP